MKYYECDMCGRTVTSHRFEEENWEITHFDMNNEEIIWKYDEKLGYYYSDTSIINTCHFCPLYSALYHDIYYPFTPRKN